VRYPLLIGESPPRPLGNGDREGGGRQAFVVRWGRPNALGLRVHHERPIGDRAHSGGLFEETAEQQTSMASASPVKSEAELVQVGLYMIGLDRPLVGTELPALHQ
jgi:hypothetical protein